MVRHGVEPLGDGPRAGLADGVLDAVATSPGAAVGGAELVLLAASPLANLELVASVGPAVAAAGATLTDVTSAQVRVGRAAARVPGLHHVGGHPMAGLETSGYEAARADLFAGRPWIVLPSALGRWTISSGSGRWWLPVAGSLSR